MNDPLLRVLAARQALADQGYSRGLLLSGAAHATTFFAVLIIALLTPPPKLITVMEGIPIPLPRGGGMPRAAEPAEPPPVEPVAPPAPEKLLKPAPVEVKKGLAPVDLKRSQKDPKKVESRETATEKIKPGPTPKAAQAPTPGAASTASGLDFTAETPGVADGVTGPTGAIGFYLAAAKNKIWANWARQLRPDFVGRVTISFTIHRDGSIDQVEIIESSGSLSLDRLAERAVVSTTLGPIPNAYEKDTIVIHATFKPLS